VEDRALIKSRERAIVPEPIGISVDLAQGYYGLISANICTLNALMVYLSPPNFLKDDNKF
jgi:hypothetical protein